MSSSTSHRPNTERSRTPIHSRDKMPKGLNPHYSHVAEGIEHFLVGPMPACEFLAAFFPGQDSRRTTFKHGIFSKVVETLHQKNKAEKSMYEPFCKAVQRDASSLVLRDTSSQCVEPGTKYAFAIKPDCTVYSKENEKVIGTNSGSRVAEFFIEFKYSSRDDPFVDTPPPPTPSQNRPSFMKDSSSAKTLIGQIGTYVAVQMDMQYRTHAFFVLVVGEYARLMRWDRSGAIFTAPIEYNDQPELFKFFEAYDAAPEARGIDEYVRKPTKEEIATGTGACPGLGNDLLVVSLHDGDMRRNYIINSPDARPSLPIGRSTRTSVAYDLHDNKCVFMKDSWRVVADNVVVEGDVIRKLNDLKIPHIPLWVDSCDVGDDKYHETKTGNFSDTDWVPSGFKFSFSKLRHHRLILGTIGEKLNKFSSTKELVCAIHDALVAHERAYREGVLHRDISPDNILIVNGRGLLIDWDMCKEKHGNEGRIGYRTSRTGTWPFMAADLVMDQKCKVKQTFIHDLESAFYVLLYQAVCYRHTSLEEVEERSAVFFQVFNTRTIGGKGNGTKFTWFSHPFSLKDFKVLDSSKGSCNEPFTSLITNLKETLGHRHVLAEYPERSGLSAFLDDKDYEALPYKHSDIIGLFSGALESSGWPEKDGAQKQSIRLEDDQQESSQYTSSKRVRATSKLDNFSASGDRSLKRQNLG